MFLYIVLVKWITVPRAIVFRCRHAERLWCITIYVCQTTREVVIDAINLSIGGTCQDGEQSNKKMQNVSFHICLLLDSFTKLRGFY